MKSTHINSIIDYFLVIGLIAFSGFPLFFNNDRLLVLFVIFTAIIWVVRSASISKRTIFYFGGFTIVILAQAIEFRFFPVETIIGFFLRIILAFFVLKSLRLDVFIKIYINTILVFSIVSFIFYIPLLFDESLLDLYKQISIPIINDETGVQIGENLLIFDLRVKDLQSTFLRNPGPFWEPGAFAGFLIIGLLFNKVISNELFNWIGMILTLALISTFSTTGYITYMFIIIAFYTNSVKRIIISFSLIALFVYFFNTLPFLHEKIISQYEEATSINLENKRKNRFGSLVVDLKDFIEYPLFGKGPNNLTRFVDPVNMKVNNRNNGITDFLVKFGLIGFCLYFISMYHSLKRVCFAYNQDKKTLLILFISLFLIAFSEVYFMYPLFFALSLLQTILIRTDIKERSVMCT